MEDFTIGAVAQRMGVPVSTIRYYESLGLLSPPQRVNGRRRYDERVFQQLVLIQLARRAGFGMRAIQTLFADARGDTPTASPWQTLATQKIAEIDVQITRMQALKAWLLEALQQPCGPGGECITVTADEGSNRIHVALLDGALRLPQGFGPERSDADASGIGR